MTTEEISKRIKRLRESKGISAREMSLSMGQSASYINRIETNRMVPSVSVLLDICDYLDISVQEFFSENEEEKDEIQRLLNKLDSSELKHVMYLLEDLSKR